MSSEQPLPPVHPIERLRVAYWDAIHSPLRRLCLVGLLTSVLAAANVTRSGTAPSRWLGLGIVAAVLLWLSFWYWIQWRQRADTRRVLTQVVRPSEPELAKRAIRAIRLQNRLQKDPSSGSLALATRFVEESLSSISLDRIRQRGRRRATGFEILAWAGLVASAVMVLTGGHRILEGCNIALSRHGRAPFAMSWLDVDSVSATPPAYLRESEHSLLFGAKVSEPVGTVISIRGTPLHPGVELVLTNGTRWARFEGNSEGELIARMSIDRTGRLRVAARFGDVFIDQQDELIVDAVADEVPAVELLDARRSIRLTQAERVEIAFVARDDHGLRQIDLVLKSVEREERRTLMRLDGQILEQQGAHALDANDAFLKSARLPVQLRVEARDDNNLVGESWGHSDWLTLEPESPGEFEANRLREIDAVRSALIDWYAVELDGDVAQGKRQISRDSVARVALDRLRLLENLPGLPQSLSLMLQAHREELEPLGRASSKSKTTLEHSVLSVDSAVHALAQRDAASVAQSLADVADELARGAHQASHTEKNVGAKRRVEYATAVLDGGGRQLRTLGSLGADLAEIVRAGLVRIGRERKADNFTHVELAAQYLAARLRRPVASAGQSSGVESGEGGEGESARPSSSDSAVRIERLLLELQQIREEHQSGLELLDRVLKGAQTEVEPDEPRAAAKQRAEKLRRLAERVPYSGAEPDTALSSQNVAREQALGMSEAIERAAPDDAVSRGRATHDAINEALIRASRETEQGGVDRKSLQALREEVDIQQQHAEQVLERTKQKAARAVSGQLHEQVARERQLAERTRALAGRKRGGEASMPEAMRSDLDKAAGWMKQASDSLDRSDGDIGYDQEKRAQAILDQFVSKSKSGERSGGTNGHGKASPATDKGSVKSTGDPQLAAAFRRRVQQGLSHEVPGDLGATIRRYAEGLLR